MKRKLIATLLVLSLMMTLAPIATIFASADEAEWYDATATDLYVNDADDMLAFAQELADGTTFAGQTVNIMADIDMTGKTWPLPATDATFSGMIDGNGYTVKGITVSSETAAASIFGNLQAVADFTVGVKNLTVTDSTVTGAGDSAGLFSAILAGGNVEFENLVLDIDVTANGVRTGEIAANSAATVSVKNVVVKGTVSSTGINAGGLFGQVVNTMTITNTVFDGVLETSATETWGNTATGGFIALVGGKVLGTEAANAAGIVTVTESAFYGKIKMTGANVGKIGFILGNTNGGDNSVVTIEDVIVAGEIEITGKLNYNYAILNGIGASTSTGTYNNVVGSLTGTIANAATATAKDLNTWGWAGKSGTATAFSLTNNIWAVVDENTESLVFTDDADPDNVITVDLSDSFTISKVAGKPVPNGVLAFFEATTVNVATADELVAIAQNIADGETYAYTMINITADIDLTDKTWPLPAADAAAFSGMINGNGFTVTGLAAANETGAASIFGTLQPVAGFTTGVKNLTITDTTVLGAGGTAGLFSEIKAGGSVVFQNLALDIDVTATGAKVATIAAISNATVAIKNVVVKGDISTTADNVAGFIATMTGTMTFDNCVFDGTIDSTAYVQWGGTPVGGFVATAGGKVNTSDAANTAGIVTFTNCAYYGKINMSTATLPDGVAESQAYSYGVGKIAPFVAQTNGQDQSVLNFENILVAGEIIVARQLMYNYGTLWGSLSSTGTANVDNVVIGLTGSVAFSSTQGHTDINVWTLGAVSSNQGKLNEGDVVKATVEAEKLVYEITDETDADNPVTTTVDLSATFTYSEDAGKVVPNGVAKFYVPAPVVPGPGENEGDEGNDAGTTTEPDTTTKPADNTTAPTTTQPEKVKFGCKSVVASAAGVLFASIMAGAVCFGKRKED